MSSFTSTPASAILENAEFLAPTSLDKDEVIQLKLDKKQRATVLVEDIKKFTDHVNELVIPAKRSFEFISLETLKDALLVENLNLQKKEIALDRTNQINSAITFEIKPDPDEDVLGYSQVNVTINPLETISYDGLTPDMFDENNILNISNINSQNYFGINKVIIKNVAVQENPIHVIKKENLVETIDFSNNKCFGAKQATVIAPLTSTTIELSSEALSADGNLNLMITPDGEKSYTLPGQENPVCGSIIGFTDITINASLPVLTVANISSFTSANPRATYIQPTDGLGYSCVEIPKLELLSAEELVETADSLININSSGNAEIIIDDATTNSEGLEINSITDTIAGDEVNPTEVFGFSGVTAPKLGTYQVAISDATRMLSTSGNEFFTLRSDKAKTALGSVKIAKVEVTSLTLTASNLAEAIRTQEVEQLDFDSIKNSDSALVANNISISVPGFSNKSVSNSDVLQYMRVGANTLYVGYGVNGLSDTHSDYDSYKDKYIISTTDVSNNVTVKSSDDIDATVFGGASIELPELYKPTSPVEINFPATRTNVSLSSLFNISENNIVIDKDSTLALPAVNTYTYEFTTANAQALYNNLATGKCNIQLTLPGTASGTTPSKISVKKQNGDTIADYTLTGTPDLVSTFTLTLPKMAEQIVELADLAIPLTPPTGISTSINWLQWYASQFVKDATGSLSINTNRTYITYVDGGNLTQAAPLAETNVTGFDDITIALPTPTYKQGTNSEGPYYAATAQISYEDIAEYSTLRIDSSKIQLLNSGTDKKLVDHSGLIGVIDIKLPEIPTPSIPPYFDITCPDVTHMPPYVHIDSFNDTCMSGTYKRDWSKPDDTSLQVPVAVFSKEIPEDNTNLAILEISSSNYGTLIFGIYNADTDTTALLKIQQTSGWNSMYIIIDAVSGNFQITLAGPTGDGQDYTHFDYEYDGNKVMSTKEYDNPENDYATIDLSGKHYKMFFIDAVSSNLLT